MRASTQLYDNVNSTILDSFRAMDSKRTRRLLLDRWELNPAPSGDVTRKTLFFFD
jgi:hypothetical protein